MTSITLYKSPSSEAKQASKNGGRDDKVGANANEVKRERGAKGVDAKHEWHSAPSTHLHTLLLSQHNHLIYNYKLLLFYYS